MTSNAHPQTTATTRTRHQTGGITYWTRATAQLPVQELKPTSEAVLMRTMMGDVLRSIRQGQRRTLRDVSSAAQMSLGYLSEVERGRKELASELFVSVCAALQVPQSRVMFDVAERLASVEQFVVPDTVPANLAII